MLKIARLEKIKIDQTKVLNFKIIYIFIPFFALVDEKNFTKNNQYTLGI